jgi:hypothetical protein
MIRCPLLTSFPVSEKERGMERGKRREKKGNRGNSGILGVLLLLPLRAMVE